MWAWVECADKYFDVGIWVECADKYFDVGIWVECADKYNLFYLFIYFFKNVAIGWMNHLNDSNAHAIPFTLTVYTHAHLNEFISTFYSYTQSKYLSAHSTHAHINVYISTFYSYAHIKVFHFWDLHFQIYLPVIVINCYINTCNIMFVGIHWIWYFKMLA